MNVILIGLIVAIAFYVVCFLALNNFIVAIIPAALAIVYFAFFVDPQIKKYNKMINSFSMSYQFINNYLVALSIQKSLDVAFDVIGDIVMASASQQYGGFTVPEVDKILSKYAEKTYNRQYFRYLDLGLGQEKSEQEALKDVEKDFRNGFQGWEYKFNTVASSRGDYPFITMTMGLGTGKFESMASKIMLEVRQGGQGKKECKKPVLFPKIVFLYDENLHGEGKPLEFLFKSKLL